MSEYTKLITELRGHIREVPLTLLHDAADALEAAEKRIAELEAQLPKDGEWITTRTENHDGEIYCSVCDHDAPTEGDYRQVKTDYCPNCGAKMKGTNNEQVDC